jgi:hypothetical protein
VEDAEVGLMLRRIIDAMPDNFRLVIEQSEEGPSWYAKYVHRGGEVIAEGDSLISALKELQDFGNWEIGDEEDNN